jgi:hypothetical protein
MSCSASGVVQIDWTWEAERSGALRDWSSLLPPKNVTRWMAFDEGRRYVEIVLAVAVLDFA